MISYLITYNRTTGAVEVEDFAEAADAMRKRLLLESSANAWTEVVVISAESEEDLHRTHRRYFTDHLKMLRDNSSEASGGSE